MLLMRELSRESQEFYRILGPIFGSRNISKQIGINVYDDEEKRFYIAEMTGTFCGLLSVRQGLISDCYTMASARRMGVLSMLLRGATLEQRNYRANCTEMSLGVFLREGFKIKSYTKNFTKVEKHA